MATILRACPSGTGRFTCGSRLVTAWMVKLIHPQGSIQLGFTIDSRRKREGGIYMDLNRRRAVISLISLMIILTSFYCPNLAAQDLVFADGFEDGTCNAWSYAVGLMTPPPAVFRVSDLDLRDPHIFVDVPLVGCLDLTDDPIPGIVPSLNQMVEDSITGDSDGDGLLDTSVLLLFRPLDQSSSGLPFELREGECTEPLATTICGNAAGSGAAISTYDSQSAGICLAPVPGTTSGYTPAISEPVASCFFSQPVTGTIPFGDIWLSLNDAQVGGTYLGDPAYALGSGLIRGFLTEADADAMLLPADIPLIGGAPLSSLPGGTGCCAASDDP